MGHDTVERRLLFVHIPKTAGSSIIVGTAGQIMIHNVDHGPVIDETTGKIKISSLNVAVRQPNYRDFFSFTVIRNPYDRFLSSYSYLMKGGQHGLDDDYQALLLQYADMDAVLDDLPRLQHKIVHFVPQSVFVCNDYHDILVHCCIRFENLQQQLLTVHPGFASLPHLNASTHDSVVLTPLQKQKIAKVYARDFRIFGYPV